VDWQKHALILAMIESLARHGSRTGKTHVIKGLFLGHAASVISAPFDFFLYKHGPYSTDIESALEQMQSYRAIKVSPAHDGYGVILRLDAMANFVKKQARLSPETEQGVERICEFIRSKNVSDLERLATAAWIRRRERINESDAVAARLHKLKPHVSLNQARAADQDLRTFLQNRA
jgi:hypothetical protein